MGAGQAILADSFGRRVDYLRISVTDRCNERCLYCMPEGYKGWSQRPDHLTAEEILGTVEAATRLGFSKFRITGGEPLIRRDLLTICRGIGRLPGVRSLGLSTNGTRLGPVAGELKAAGVRSVNISLDALDAAVYRKITGGDLESALDGIEAAVGAGIPSVKLNCVLLAGLNEDQLLPIVRYAAKRDVVVRFIELMPFARTAGLDEENSFPVGKAMVKLAEAGELVALPDFRPGHGPAVYYEFRPLNVRVGFIGAMTTPHFCASCNKLRLTADGKLRPCLGRHGEIDLLAALRGGGGAADVLRAAVANKPEDHEFLRNYETTRPMTAIGG